ncbi:MAG: proprotein convertase P-domain-containing protein [Deltaproteobacteria bacterium]|nr:proprotein convertase P-domain-containing protein [Deltaproteobacteria bacterium]
MTRVTLALALLAASCAQSSVEPWDVRTDDSTDALDVDALEGLDMPGDDAGWDVLDAPPDAGSDLVPDFADAWDMPELDISDEAIGAYGHVYTPAGSFPIVIPDDAPAGVDSRVEVPDIGTVIAVGVSIAIRHPARGNLRISITSPDGTTARLANHEGGYDDDLVTFYPDVTAPADDFTRFVGESTSGFWSLNVADDYTPDVGQLEDWVLYLSY